MELCEHLNPVLEHELERGNTVRSSETGWSKVDLLVFLNERLDVDFAKARTSPTVTYMRNTDPHYGGTQWRALHVVVAWQARGWKRPLLRMATGQHYPSRDELRKERAGH